MMRGAYNVKYNIVYQRHYTTLHITSTYHLIGHILYCNTQNCGSSSFRYVQSKCGASVERYCHITSLKSG